MSLTISFDTWIDNQGDDLDYDCPECMGSGVKECEYSGNDVDCYFCDFCDYQDDHKVPASEASYGDLLKVYKSQVAEDLKKYSLYTGKDFFDLMSDFFRSIK